MLLYCSELLVWSVVAILFLFVRSFARSFVFVTLVFERAVLFYYYKFIFCKKINGSVGCVFEVGVCTSAGACVRADVRACREGEREKEKKERKGERRELLCVRGRWEEIMRRVKRVNKQELLSVDIQSNPIEPQ